MKKHKYGFKTDIGEIVTAGFIINYYGDESVGIFDASWTLKPDAGGPFYFTDEKELEEFKGKLEDAFEIVTGERCGVETFEEQGKRLEYEEIFFNSYKK
jgi:hypothetical protein